MANLLNLLQKLPSSVGDVTNERISGVSKNIKKNISPKRIISRNFSVLQGALTSELPELGNIMGMLTGFGSDIMSNTNKKVLNSDKNKEKETKKTVSKMVKVAKKVIDKEKQPKPQSTVKTNINDNKLLSAIDSGIQMIVFETGRTTSELKTLTSITSKVWDIDKKTLLATRRANDIQIDLARNNKFTKQSAAGVAKDSESNMTPMETAKTDVGSIIEQNFGDIAKSGGFVDEIADVAKAYFGIKYGPGALSKVGGMVGGIFSKVGSLFGKTSSVVSGGIGAAATVGSKLTKVATGAEIAGDGFKMTKLPPDYGALKTAGKVASKTLGYGAAAYSAYTDIKDALDKNESDMKLTSDSLIAVGKAMLYVTPMGIGLIANDILKFVLPDFYKSWISDPISQFGKDTESYIQKKLDSYYTDDFQPKKLSPSPKLETQSANIHFGTQNVDTVKTASQMSSLQNNNPMPATQNVISAPSNTTVNTVNNTVLGNNRSGNLTDHIYANISQ